MTEQGGRGGVADYTGELTRALAPAGCDVVLATAADHQYLPAPGVTVRPVFHYVRGDSRIARRIRRIGLGPIANALRFLLAIPRLARLAAQADVVHSQGWEFAPLGVLAVFAMRLTGTPAVLTSHNTFDRGKAQDRAHRMLAMLTAATIVHTRADLSRVPVKAGRRVTQIPHGEYGSLARRGGTADPLEARRSLGIDPEVPVVLMFGQLRTDKGLDDLLRALLDVAPLHLLVAGQELGALAACTTQLRSPELEDRVTVREGFVEMSEAARLFAAADVAAMPYQNASQSGVLLLSYGFSRPVLVYPVGGLAEAVLDGETGWVCDRPDVASLVEALKSVVAAGRPECRRRGRAGHALANERFSWTSCAASTVELYRAVLAGRSRQPAPQALDAKSTADL
jgi:glycosyltransferase involved in cell wall biosynthesis